MAASLVPAVGAARGRKSEVVFEPDPQNAPSAIYGALDAAACKAELRQRKVVFTEEPPSPGVMAPVRIPEGVGGVVYRTALPRAQGKTSPWEVFDCRLVLALYDFSAILRQHGIDEAEIFSAWRPPPKTWPADKEGRRHPGGLAVDIGRFGLEQPPPAPAETPAEKPAGKPPKKRWLNVKKDFHGRIGDKSCGKGARGPRQKTPEAQALRALYCEAADARIFTSMLSPNYDRPHHNHFHLEVTPGVKWRLIR